MTLPAVVAHRPIGGVTRISRRAIRMGRRRGELAKLLKHRGGDLGHDLSAWARVIADIAVFARVDFDLLGVAQVARRAGIALPDAIVVQALNATAAVVARKGALYQPIGATAVGRMLGVTLAEKVDLGLRTMHAAAESADERRARMRAARLKRDREAKRAKRASQRPHAVSKSRLRPWEAEGMSRATWYRRQKSGETKMSADNLTYLYAGRHICLTAVERLSQRAAPSALKDGSLRSPARDEFPVERGDGYQQGSALRAIGKVPTEGTEQPHSLGARVYAVALQRRSGGATR